MKKSILGVAITLLGLALVGCSAAKDKETQADASKEITVTQAPTPTPYQVRQVPVDANATQLTVDLTKTYQTIEGFGASYTWYSDWMTRNVNKEKAYDLLFDESGMTILRFKNNYMYTPTFSASVEKEIYEEAKERAAKRGEKVTVLLSSWSPAAYLKENNKIPGGSSIKKDENGNYMYDELAQYFKEAVKAYQDQGVPIDYLSIQNECDFVASYDGCEFAPVETSTQASYAKAFLAVYDAIQTLENPPKMLGPETMTVSDVQINNYIKDILKEKPESLYGIAHHLYSGGTHERPDSFMMPMMSLYQKFPDLARWQTEFYRGDVMQTVSIIHNSMVFENLNAYLYWEGVWGDKGGMMAFGWAANSPLVVGDKIYAMEHFSKFIRPGYKRVDVKNENYKLKVSAYASPTQDKVVVVAINPTDTDTTFQLHFPNFEVSEAASYQSMCKAGYTNDDLFQPGSGLSDTQTFDLPAGSVITFDISGKSYAANATESDSQQEAEIIANTYQAAYGQNTQAKEEEIINVVNGDHGASAVYSTTWDEKNLYVQVKVTDNTPGVTDDAWKKDGVVIFMNEKGTKPETYGEGDYYYLITRDGKVTGSAKQIPAGVNCTVEDSTSGYTVKATIPFATLQGAAGTKLGFDIRVNDSHSSDILNYILQWADTSAVTENNLSAIGTLELTK